MHLSDRDIETLGDLEAANRNLAEGGRLWAKPLDCGGYNGSHHGATLIKLAKAGLVDKKGYTPGCRAVWMYKINEAGRQAWKNYCAARRASPVPE